MNTKVLYEDWQSTVVELSADYLPEYCGISIDLLIAKMSREGVALCRVDESNIDRPVVHLFLGREAMATLIESYQVYLQTHETHDASNDSTLGDLDDHPF
jgi:hypothetical protein